MPAHLAVAQMRMPQQRAHACSWCCCTSVHASGTGAAVESWSGVPAWVLVLLAHTGAPVWTAASLAQTGRAASIAGTGRPPTIWLMMRRALARRRLPMSFRKPEAHTAMGMGLLPMHGPPGAFNRSRMDARHGGLAPSASAAPPVRVARICSSSSPPPARPRGATCAACSTACSEPVVALSRRAHSGAVRLLSESGERLQLVSDIGLPTPCTAAEATVNHRAAASAATAAGAAAHRLVASICASLRRARRRRRSATYGTHGGRCSRNAAVPRCWASTTCSSPTRPGPSPQGDGAALRSVGELLGTALDNARLERRAACASVMQTDARPWPPRSRDSIAQTLTFVKRMRLPLLQGRGGRGDEARSLAYGRRAPGGGRRARQPARDRHPLPHAHRPARPRPCAGGAGGALPRAQHHRAQLQNTGAPLSLSDRSADRGLPHRGEALANIERHSQARHAQR